MQDCSNSIVKALELQQSCPKLLIYQSSSNYEAPHYLSIQIQLSLKLAITKEVYAQLTAKDEFIISKLRRRWYRNRSNPKYSIGWKCMNFAKISWIFCTARCNWNQYISLHVTKTLFESPVPQKRSVMWRFYVFLDVSLSKLMNKRPSCRWFQTTKRSYDITVMNGCYLVPREMNKRVVIRMSHFQYQRSNS